MNEQIQTIVVGMLPKETTGYGNNDMIRRIYSVDGIAPTIRTYGGGNQEPKVMVIAYDEQNRNLNDWGGCGTLTTDGSSPKHNNRVVEIEGGDSMPDTNENTVTYSRAGFDESVNIRIRIRKLTPKECWRLMGFDDASFERAAEVNSNTQLYKQAGNSIVVDVLMAILKPIVCDG